MKNSKVLNDKFVIKAILTGVLNANRKYVVWSGGYSVRDFGIESFVSGQIAEQLVKLREDDFSGFVTMESHFTTIRENSRDEALDNEGESESGYDEDRKERADIVYWNKDGRVEGIVEVKRYFDYHKVKDDISRIHGLMKHAGAKQGKTLKWGAVTGLRVLDEYRKNNAEVLEDAQKKAESEKTFEDLEFTSGHRELKVKKFKNKNGNLENEYENEKDITGYAAFVLFFKVKE